MTTERNQLEKSRPSQSDNVSQRSKHSAITMTTKNAPTRHTQTNSFHTRFPDQTKTRTSTQVTVHIFQKPALPDIPPAQHTSCKKTPQKVSQQL